MNSVNVVNESDRIAAKISFLTCCRLFEKLKTSAGTKTKKHILSGFVQLWANQYMALPQACADCGFPRASFYSLLRLLLPQYDRARPAFGLRQNTLGRLYVKALGIAPNSSLAQLLAKPSADRKGTDFADVLYEAIRDRCRDDSILSLKDVNEFLDSLAVAPTQEKRLALLDNFVRSATALEHKWIVRLIDKRQNLCGLSGDGVFQCFHPAAVALWDVTQDLLVLCERIANIDPHTPAPAPGASLAFDLQLFIPFRPMLCERANSSPQLCTSALQLCAANEKDSSNIRLLLECKYDGERVQVHKSGTCYRYWSRNCLEWTSSYGPNPISGTFTPRLHSAFAAHVRDCIIDGEMMGFDTWTDSLVPKTGNYDVKRRQRSRTASVCLASNEKDAYQPCLIAFDLLLMNGEARIMLNFHFEILVMAKHPVHL